MKLSNETISVLKNFSTINQNLVIKSGNKIATMSAMKNIVAKAEVIEDFPQTFAIYDLNEFLSAISLFSKPELEFENDFVMITEEGTSKSLKYWYSDPSVVTTPTKDITMPESALTFTITDSQLASIRKASGALKANDMVITKNIEGGLWTKLTVTDRDNPTSNEFSINIANCSIDTEENFEFVFNINNFKFNQANEYKFEVASKMISKVTTDNVDYWLALEKSSKFGV